MKTVRFFWNYLKLQVLLCHCDSDGLQLRRLPNPSSCFFQVKHNRAR